MSSLLEVLRSAIADETLGLSERKTASEHYIAELLDAVSVPAEDDADVVALVSVTPPAVDSILGDLFIRGWEYMNTKRGWRESGPTVPQAMKHVRDRLRFRALLAVVVDEDAHRLGRLEACRRVLEDHLPPRGYHRQNGYSPEQMLAKVLPTTATKYGGWNKSPVPVVRPPQCMADVWEP